jgi:hypothetical protein
LYRVDSATEQRAFDVSIASLFYGKDPLIATLFKRAVTDSSLLLFDTAPDGWTSAQWQRFQLFAFREYVSVWSASALNKLKTTRKPQSIAVFCNTMRATDRSLALYADQTQSAAGRQQAVALREVIQPSIDRQSGLCRI